MEGGGAAFHTYQMVDLQVGEIRGEDYVVVREEFQSANGKCLLMERYK